MSFRQSQMPHVCLLGQIQLGEERWVCAKHDFDEVQVPDHFSPMLKHRLHGKGIAVPSEKRGKLQIRASGVDSLIWLRRGKPAKKAETRLVHQ